MFFSRLRRSAKHCPRGFLRFSCPAGTVADTPPPFAHLPPTLLAEKSWRLWLGTRWIRTTLSKVELDGRKASTTSSSTKPCSGEREPPARVLNLSMECDLGRKESAASQASFSTEPGRTMKKKMRQFSRSLSEPRYPPPPSSSSTPPGKRQ